MALIKINCSKCNQEIEADESMYGHVIHCLKCGHRQSVLLQGFKAGDNIGGFVVEKKLGIGGMGEVWLAHQTSMSRKVALKILAPHLSRDPHFLARFTKEVQISAKMDHPNIVTAFDAGEDHGFHYLAISYIDGDTLFNKIKNEHTIFEDEALKIARAIAEGLGFAWDDFKILHRDIKPENIMIDKKGIPKLMDMGISKNLSEDYSVTLTEVGAAVGSPYYMSPEQADGKKGYDCRADIYSLGATLYHMLTGTVPFDGDTLVQVLAQHLNEPLTSPDKINPDISKPCCELVSLMMAKEREDRPHDWKEVIENIDRVLNGEIPVLKNSGATVVECKTNVGEVPAFPFGEDMKKVRSTDKARESQERTKEEILEILEGAKPSIWPMAIIFFIIIIIGGIGVYLFIRNKQLNKLPPEVPKVIENKITDTSVDEPADEIDDVLPPVDEPQADKKSLISNSTKETKEVKQPVINLDNLKTDEPVKKVDDKKVPPRKDTKEAPVGLERLKHDDWENE